MDISPKKGKLGMEKTISKFSQKPKSKPYVNMYKDTNVKVSDLVDASF
jgi:hypothetical protein